MEKIIAEIKRLSLFNEEEQQRLIDKLRENDKGKTIVECLVRKTDIILTPEEAVRQLFLDRLINEYKYPVSRIKLEHAIHFGREVKRADIVIFEKERPTTEYIIIELKKSKEKDGKEQLRSYCNATGATMSVWTNGSQITFFNRKDPNYFEEIPNIPTETQSLKDILDEPFTLKDLIIKDKILKEGKSLRQIIENMEDEVLANAGVDVFEECFKLIFTKLYDESLSKKDKEIISYYVDSNCSCESLADLEYKDYIELVKEVNDKKFRQLEFRNKGETDLELKKKIQKLFDGAKTKWKGVFTEDAKINLSPSHLSVCVSSIQDIKLFNSNLQIIDEAFEYLINKSSKGEKGQYFTPRHVIDMCVKMLNPQKGEYMIDTASGSCGFPVHTIFKITGKLFSNADIPDEEKENVLKIFGIDFDEKAVRVARTLNLIAGDGNTNVLHLNTLDYDRWQNTIESLEWYDTYGEGVKRLKKLQKDKESYKEFNFDILMANPPFAGDIKEQTILAKYDLAFKDENKNKMKSKVGRDILFIERNLDFVRPGGRLAIVLPQGRFNNTSDKDIREYIAQKARILAVVGLDVNTFKPHTGTKTSVIFLQKWNDDDSEPKYYCPKVEDYPIFFAVSEKSGKDNSGEYIYTKDENGRLKLDKHGHFVLEHDLHNHDGDLPDGIAEAFIDFAKSEKLSFWGEE
ncbi:TPA: SAM-dependent methyltransferase [Candidatus Gastranaerophilales bacterium HUM_9]|nr:MAG TPA: SAM-dependent methyltransferase [Candidatus Gastranaerophilales bacterium HUM_9]HBX34938.1 SAM-dependent methyltransferase [Cyanobacteria bacterium UBA11440]